MTQPTALRFFAVVLTPAPAVVVSAGAIVAFGGYLALTSPGQSDQMFALALLLQMFAAATGFVDRARRGHFDPVLIFPARRASAATAHAAISALTGVATWVALAGVDLLASPGHWSNALTFSGVAAVLYVSAVAWAATLYLPRYTAGVLWVLVFLFLAASHYMQGLQQTFLADTATWANAWKVAGAALVCPILLVAYPLAAGDISVGLVCLIAGAVFAIGVWIVTRFDVRLEEPS